VSCLLRGTRPTTTAKYRQVRESVWSERGGRWEVMSWWSSGGRDSRDIAGRVEGGEEGSRLTVAADHDDLAPEKL